MLGLQRDIEDLVEEFPSSRAFRNELDRIFDESTSPRAMWREMERLMDEFESPVPMRTRAARLFEDVMGTLRRPFARTRDSYVPDLELTEHDGEYVMKADLPGMREQDIDLRVDDNSMLTISGERHEEGSKRIRGYEYSERAYGAFSRSVALPSGVDPEKVSARFENGVLEVHIPKTEAAMRRARKIPLSSREEPRVMGAGNGPTSRASSRSS